MYPLNCINMCYWNCHCRDTNDGGCVNDQQLRDFSNKYAVIPTKQDCDGIACDNDKRPNMYTKEANEKIEFTYTVKNPAFGGSMWGLSIEQQIAPFRTSIIKVGRPAYGLIILLTYISLKS